MSTEAHIAAIGAFQPELAPYMNYPEDCYKDVAPGTQVLVTHMLCTSTRDSSFELAKACGTSFMDFATHDLGDGSKVDEQALEAMEEAGQIDGSVERFRALCAGGFRFFFVPEF